MPQSPRIPLDVQTAQSEQRLNNLLRIATELRDVLRQAGQALNNAGGGGGSSGVAGGVGPGANTGAGTGAAAAGAVNQSAWPQFTNQAGPVSGAAGTPAPTQYARNAQGQFVTPTAAAMGSGSGAGGYGAGIAAGGATAGGPTSSFDGGQPGVYSAVLAHYGVNLAAHTVASGFDIATQQQLTGRANPMDIGRSVGTTVGAIVGGLAGSAFGPAGTVIGAGAGATIFSSAAGYFFAGLQNSINAVDEASRLHATVGMQGNGGLDSFGLNGREVRMGEIQRQLSPKRFDLYGFNEQEVAKGYNSTAQGMLLGGLDPYQKYGSKVYGPSAGELQEHINAVRDMQGGGRTSAAGVLASGQVAIDQIRMQGAGREEYAETITRRAFARYRNKGADVLKDVGEIYAGIPETGDNLIDSIAKYGPLKTMEFERLQTEDGTLPIDAGSFFKISAGLRRTQLGVRRAGLQARGKGQAASDLLSGQMAALAEVPGGKDSTTYMELAAQNRDAGRQAFDEKSITSYAIPATKLEGQMARAELQPYSPSNMYRLSLQHIQLSNQRIGQLTDYMQKRKASGQLSEAEELDLTQQIEQNKTAKTRDEATLQDNFLSRLPAQLSGGQRYQARYSSPVLTSMALEQMGNNTIRRLGAASGRHLAAQDAEYADVQGDTPTRAYSRTAVAGKGGTEEQTNILRDIRDLLRQNSGKKSGRADEALSGVQNQMNRYNGSGDSSGGFSPSFN